MHVSNLSICKRFTSTKSRVLITGYPVYPGYYQMLPRKVTLRPNFESTATRVIREQETQTSWKARGNSKSSKQK